VDDFQWVGRKVLLTGHTGFKGSWAALMLLARGASVVGYSLAPESTSQSLFQLSKLSADMESHFGDVADLAKLSAVVAEAKPEIVIHMAAQALVRRSYDAPVDTYRTNVLGSIHLLEAVRSCDNTAVVLNVTSDKCYENREWSWPYREADALGGHDPYSSSKACAELVTAAYAKSFLIDDGVQVATARAGNVIGGGDWAEDRLVPDAIRSFVAERPLMVRNPLAIRPWQHVVEANSGYLRLCERLASEPAHRAFDSWNFGPSADDARAVGDVADALVAGWGGSAEWNVADTGAEPHEARLLTLDSSKARSELGWRPRLNADDAVERTIAWYRSWNDGADVRAVTMAEIADYERIVP